MPVNTSGRKTLLFIVGPTAVGKTGFALKLAKKLDGEIISADSMQVYKKMPILSQAPPKCRMKNIRHHLVESIDPRREYSAADFICRAGRIIKAIIKKGRTPIIVGGSGLYIKALIDGLFPSPEADPAFRKKMYLFASRYGVKRLHDRLVKIDPAAAAKIHLNDIRRTVRALEICNSTGRTMTELKLSTRGLKDKYRIEIFGLKRPREELYRRIDSRVDKMFRDGVLEEAKKLMRTHLSKTAEHILGFDEIRGYIEGQYDIDKAKDMLKKNTRRFAKRQLTWFRADKRIRWFDLSKIGAKEIIAKAIKGK